jgi:hypothetical protein
MASLARTVILESVAQQAVDSACDKWEDAERAWIAIEWALARDQHVGVPLTEGAMFGAFSTTVPDLLASQT